MSEDDPTKALSGEDTPTVEPTFEQRVMQRFDALDARLSVLGTKVDERLKDTRPIWQAVEARLERVEEKLDHMNDKLDILNGHVLSAQAHIASLGRRVTELEGQRP